MWWSSSIEHQEPNLNASMPIVRLSNIMPESRRKLVLKIEYTHTLLQSLYPLNYRLQTSAAKIRSIQIFHNKTV